MRCVDCHWFLSKAVFGRDRRSCQDLGEIPQNEACNQFTPLNNEIVGNAVITPTAEEVVPKSQEEIQDFLGALSEQKYRDIFHEILSESFILEQDVRFSVQTIRAQLQTQGAEVSADAKEFEKTAGKLVDLYVLYRMINATGLSAFTDKIMDVAINRAFEPPPPSSPAVASPVKGRA